MRGSYTFSMSKPCIVIASFQPLPRKTAELVALLESVIPQVHQEEGCELYALHQEVSGKLVMIEKWTTQAHWHVHNNAPSVAAIQAGLPGLLDGTVVVEEMYGHEVGDATKDQL